MPTEIGARSVPSLRRRSKPNCRARYKTITIVPRGSQLQLLYLRDGPILVNGTAGLLCQQRRGRNHGTEVRGVNQIPSPASIDAFEVLPRLRRRSMDRMAIGRRRQRL